MGQCQAEGTGAQGTLVSSSLEAGCIQGEEGRVQSRMNSSDPWTLQTRGFISAQGCGGKGAGWVALL